MELELCELELLEDELDGDGLEDSELLVEEPVLELESGAVGLPPQAESAPTPRRAAPPESRIRNSRRSLRSALSSVSSISSRSCTTLSC